MQRETMSVTKQCRRVRMSEDVIARVTKLAQDERRTWVAMVEILVEEALRERDGEWKGQEPLVLPSI